MRERFFLFVAGIGVQKMVEEPPPQDGDSHARQAALAAAHARARGPTFNGTCPLLELPDRHVALWKSECHL